MNHIAELIKSFDAFIEYALAVGKFSDVGFYEKAKAALISEREAVEAAEAKYHELLYAVESKFPDETRHETALRYIRERESAELGPAQQEQTE